MFEWVPYAMVRIAIFFVGGILLCVYQPKILSIDELQWLSIGLLVAYLACYFFRLKFPLQTTTGIVGLAFVFVAGYWHVTNRTESNRSNHIINYAESVDGYTAEVISGASERENSWRFLLGVRTVKQNGEWSKALGKIHLFWPKRYGDPKLLYGDIILVNGSPGEMRPPGNPGEFDYKRFLQFKNIYHQQFGTPDNVIRVSNSDRRGLIYYSLKARAWAAARIKEFVEGEREQAIAMALSLGVTDGIDNDLQGAYAASGAMHVLAVSGLHVGILYMIVLFLLRPLGTRAWSRWVIAGASLLVLWSFAFITGLSPSVLRAVTMFSFVALAKPFGRSTTIYNTLAGSAFVLLIVDPYLVMSVGFQLSYLAVLGIVYLHRPLYNLWEPSSAVLDWVWSITCIAISAQLATFSLGLLYFHQFPTYFMFSNLFVIPGAVIILVLSISVIVLGFIQPIAMGLGWILQKCIAILNFGVFTIEQLPNSLIEGVYITTLQSWMLIASVVFMALLFTRRNFSLLIPSMLCVVVYAGIQWFQFYQDIRTSTFVVYNVSGHSGLEWMGKGRSFFYSDSVLLNDAERIRFHIQPLRLRRGVEQTEARVLHKGISILQHQGKVVVYAQVPTHSMNKKIKADYLIIGANSFRSFSQIEDLFEFNVLILDGSNSWWTCNRILAEAEAQNRKAHSVLHHGAFLQTL